MTLFCSLLLIFSVVGHFFSEAKYVRMGHLFADGGNRKNLIYYVRQEILPKLLFPLGKITESEKCAMGTFNLMFCNTQCFVCIMYTSFRP